MMREKLEALAKGLDCGDHSCRYAVDKTGQRTNGGCRCTVRKVTEWGIRMRDAILAAEPEPGLREIELREAYLKGAVSLGPMSFGELDRVRAEARKLYPEARTPPQKPAGPIMVDLGAPLFSFSDFEDWCDTARWKFQESGMHSVDALCLDKAGRVCTKGAEFMRARDEGTFPVQVFRVGIPSAPRSPVPPEGGKP
jgi:hypothetical protein